MRQAAHYQTLESRQLSRFISEWSSAGPPLRVLDFGCGRGRLLRELVAQGCRVTGADLNQDYVAELSDGGFDVHEPGAVLRGAQRYDVVLVSHVIEHLDPKALHVLVPELCQLLAPGGRLVVITPVPGERFYHDSTHVRPYTPQSFRHAFGQDMLPVSVGGMSLLELDDIYFFRDPFRTRHRRHFYRRGSTLSLLLTAANSAADTSWRLSGGRVGVTASWLGVYRLRATVARGLGDGSDHG